ncbi:MAG: hypothetical protein IKN18_05555 [Neisseriaceae bacterium]|nr:hypothetical protein [Neisseriaceae bacterium]
MSPLMVEYSISKMAHILCAVLHISTLLMVLFYLDTIYWWLIFPLLFSWLYGHYQYSAYNSNRITHLEIRPNRQAVITVQHESIEVALEHNSFYGKYLMLLIWRSLKTGKIYRHAIFPDMCHADSRRRLRVYCKTQKS